MRAYVTKKTSEKSEIIWDAWKDVFSNALKVWKSWRESSWNYTVLACGVHILSWGWWWGWGGGEHCNFSRKEGNLAFTPVMISAAAEHYYYYWLIWQSPGLPGWRKVNLITVTRRPLHPSIAAGFNCLTTSPGFLPALCEKWSGFFYVHRVWLSYTRDRRLKVSPERLGNEDKAPCPRALLPGRGSNWGPPVWKAEVLTARPRQLLNG